MTSEDIYLFMCLLPKSPLRAGTWFCSFVNMQWLVHSQHSMNIFEQTTTNKSMDFGRTEDPIAMEPEPVLHRL